MSYLKNSMKLTPTQKKLYDAMRHGVEVAFIDDGKYFFRSDTWAKCTRASKALLYKKLIYRSSSNEVTPIYKVVK